VKDYYAKYFNTIVASSGMYERLLILQYNKHILP